MLKLTIDECLLWIRLKILKRHILTRNAARRALYAVLAWWLRPRA